MKVMDKPAYGPFRATGLKMLTIMLIAALLWSTVGFVSTVNAGPIGPKYTWVLFDAERNFVDVAYGNGVYVAISETSESLGHNLNKLVSTVWISSDMLDWTPVDLTELTTRPLATVLYYGDRFILTSKHSSATIWQGPTQLPLYDGAAVLHSINGTDWIALPNGVSDHLNNTMFTSGVYFNNRFFIGTANSNAARVFNTTWGSVSMLPSNSYYHDLIVHAGKLFAGGFNYNTPNLALGVTEDHGATWTTNGSNVIASIRSFASDGNTLIGVGKTSEHNSVATPAAVVINHPDPIGIGLTKGTLAGPFVPQVGEFVSASYSVADEQFLALSNNGEVYYSEDKGVTWHPDYSTMGAGTGLISTSHGDFAFTSAGVFKRKDNLGDHGVNASVTGTHPSATTLQVAVDDSNAVPVSEAGVVYSTSDKLEPEPSDLQQAGIAGADIGSNKLFHVTISGLDGGTEYYYWPYSKDTMGYIYYGERGSFETMVPAEAPMLSQLEGATVTQGDPGPVLSVTAVVYDNGDLTYQWYSNSVSSNSGGALIAGANQSTYIVPTDTVGTLYYYVGVTNTLIDVGETTAFSNSAKVTVYPNLPKVIDSIDDQTLMGLETGYDAGTQENRDIAITNIGTTDLTNIHVSLSGLHADSFTLTQPAATLAKGAPATSFTIVAANGLPAGTYEAVVTVTADGMAPVSFKVLQLINNANAPEIPQNLTAVGGNGSVDLNWDTVTGATYYNVYVSTFSLQFEEADAITVAGSTYTVSGLTNGATYYFVVKSGASGLSGFSNQASATPMSVPDAPADVTASTSNGSIRLSFAAPADGGSPITGYEVISSSDESFEVGASLPIVIRGLKFGQTYSFEVRAVNAVGSGPWSDSSNEVTPREPDPEEPAGGGVNEEEAVVLVNGKEERIGKVTTVETNGRKTTTISVDEGGLRERLAQAGQSPVITLPVDKDSEVIIGELTGDIVNQLESFGAIVEIRTPRGTYALPAAQVDISAVAAHFGNDVDLHDIKLNIEIAVSSQAALQSIQDKAGADGLELVGEPLHFAVYAVYNGVSLPIDFFKQYVERSIAMPEGVDPAQITTGVVLESDGTLRHVPTQVTQSDGRYYAVINSLTNSDYAVVWNPLEFDDIGVHWSKQVVNDMGSRLIVNGIANGKFGPDRNVTRAEFAAMVATGLGLKLQTGKSTFSDVSTEEWFSASINTAAAYGLINGFEDGTFRPQELITREQAMVIIAKAMAVTGLNAQLPAASADSVLQPFNDGATVSGWAASAVADNVQAGIVQGRGNAELAPQANMTRAEAAVLIRLLLQKSGLI